MNENTLIHTMYQWNRKLNIRQKWQMWLSAIDYLIKKNWHASDISVVRNKMDKALLLLLTAGSFYAGLILLVNNEAMISLEK